MRRPLFLALAAFLLLTGCSGKSDSALPGPASPTAAAPSLSPLPTCAPANTAAYTWPTPVPADLPKLPGVVLTGTKKTTDGLTIVSFHTETSLRDGVIFIVKRLPPAGFTLGRGDAEATEADAPFTKGDLRGVIRGAARTLCQTDWILAVTRGTPGGSTGSPLLPSHTGPSPSPLPFG
jgi:hypothetical protein